MDENKEISFFPLIMTVLRARRLVLRNLIGAVVLAAVISLVLPSRWRAVATLMPPQEKEGVSMNGLVAQLNVPGITIPKPATTAQLFVEILRSRSVNERVLGRSFVFKNDSLPLYRILRYPSVNVGLYKMVKKTQFMVQPNDIISVAVELRDPRLAADVANAYVEELDRVIREKNVSRAKNSRVYIESQLAETQEKMRESAERLIAFQQRNKAVSLEAQVQAFVEQAAELSGRIMAKEIEIGVMLQSMTPENPLVVRAQNELAEMRRQAKELEYGKAAAGQGASFLPFQNIPPVALRLADLLREAKVQETVWQLLNQQYYQAKIEEARNTPTVQILDAAVPPLYRSFPNRKLLVIVAGVLAALLTLLFVAAEEYYRNLQERPDGRRKLEMLRAELAKGWNPFKTE